jgi:TM2 domain-containing membrane protein YozV
MLGPQVSTSMGRFRPFAHLLFGADRFYAKANKDGIANTGGAGAFGVGLDVRLHRNLSVRLGQLDYIRSYHSGSGINAGRYSAGLVFCFGRK